MLYCLEVALKQSHSNVKVVKILDSEECVTRASTGHRKTRIQCVWKDYQSGF